jgi:hypothetical protein
VPEAAAHCSVPEVIGLLTLQLEPASNQTDWAEVVKGVKEGEPKATPVRTTADEGVELSEVE